MSEVWKRYGFWRPGLRTGVKNDIFWSEIGSGFGVPCGTRPPRFPRSIPSGVEQQEKGEVSPFWARISLKSLVNLLIDVGFCFRFGDMRGPFSWVGPLTGIICSLSGIMVVAFYQHWFLKRISDHIKFLGNCPPTPPLTQHFAPSETEMLTLS